MLIWICASGIFFSDDAHAEMYDLFGEPITDEEIANNTKKLGRLGWTILYGDIGLFIGLGVDRTSNPKRTHAGIVSLVGAVAGGTIGYLYGNKHDKAAALHKINRTRWRMRLKDNTLDEALRMRAMMAEATEINMGLGYRWGYTILGLYVGMGTGLTIGYGLRFVDVRIPGGALGALVGVSYGYVKGVEADGRTAEAKARRWLQKQGVRPKNISRFPSLPLRGETAHVLSHCSTDYIVPLIVVRF